MRACSAALRLLFQPVQGIKVNADGSWCLRRLIPKKATYLADSRKFCMSAHSLKHAKQASGAAMWQFGHDEDMSAFTAAIGR